MTEFGTFSMGWKWSSSVYIRTYVLNHSLELIVKCMGRPITLDSFWDGTKISNYILQFQHNREFNNSKKKSSSYCRNEAVMEHRLDKSVEATYKYIVNLVGAGAKILIAYSSRTGASVLHIQLISYRVNEPSNEWFSIVHIYIHTYLTQK